MDHHACVPEHVREMLALQDATRAEVAASRSALQLRKSLSVLSTGYIPCAETEQAVSDGLGRIADLDRRIRRGLEHACTTCPSRMGCLARMT